MGVGAYLPQFEQSEAPRLTADGFFVDLELLQFLQFDCFIAFTSYVYGVQDIAALYEGKIFPISDKMRVYTQNKGMEKNRYTVDPTDEMIQGNKEEADSMLRLWGKKKRARIQPRSLRKK